MVKPNQLFLLDINIKELIIGPVHIVHRSIIEEKINYFSSPLRLLPQEKERYNFSYEEESEKTILCLPDVNWIINMEGMRKPLDNYALWLVDVAVSFFLISCPENLVFNFFKIDFIERHPFNTLEGEENGIFLYEEMVGFQSQLYLSKYKIDEKILVHFSSKEIVQKADYIFNFRDGSLGERIYQALGWLTRARRAADPAERVLALFTALEALLTSSNKADPVTQTIMRNVGVIWHADPQIRLQVANKFSKWYEIRSDIVHRGSRNVFGNDVEELNLVIWTVTYIILNKAKLDMSHVEFIKQLKEASYGAPWQPTPPDVM